MRIKLPQPLHGWREFLGEVGIVVLGVMIALAAQQAVERIKARREVQIFREAVHKEVGSDLGTYAFRVKNDECIGRRLDDLQRWLGGWRSGSAGALAGQIGLPQSLSLQTSAWQSRDEAVVSNMPMDERMSLGWLYDQFANAEIHRLDERQAWLELGQYDGAKTLTHDDQMRLQALITRARYRADRLKLSGHNILQRAAEMGIAPSWDNDPRVLHPDFCRSIFPRTPTK